MSSDDKDALETSSAMQALDELEEVLLHLRDGVADWRRRALKAEAEQAELGKGDSVRLHEHMRKLEADNAELHQRVEMARNRVQELLGRLRFLEEQVTLKEHRS